MVIYYLTLSFS